MASTLEGLALTEAHDAAQAANTAKALQASALTFQGLLDPENIEKGFEAYAATATAVMNEFKAKSGAIAGDYYTALRSIEGATEALKAIPAPVALNAAQATTSLYVTGPKVFQNAVAQGLSVDEAYEKAMHSTLGAVGRHVQNGGREVVQGAVQRDPAARGWSRVSGGNPCSFCAMLISRGPVYRGQESGGFKTHDHCRCRAVPFFQGTGWTAQATEFRRIWNESAHGKSGPDAMKAFRGRYVEKFPPMKAGQVRRLAFGEHGFREAARDAQKMAAEVVKAEAEAHALVKKWKGKPAPAKPTAPAKPMGKGKKFLHGDWLDRVNARYDALGTGKPLSGSYNYSYVQKVLDEQDLDALKYLRDNKYLDGALYDDARLAFLDADLLDGDDLAAYKKSLRSFRNLSTRHKRYIEEWRQVNGVSNNRLRGMDGARDFTSNADAMDWANGVFHKFSGGAEKDALRNYTGSDYRYWNQALRDNADRTRLPAGWEEKTRLADAGIARSPMPEDVILRRGTNLDEFEFPGGVRTTAAPPPDPRELIGTVQTQHGYWSTSVGTDAAFSSNPVSMVIRVPEGHGGAWVDNFSNFRGEREVILERSTNFFVHDVRKEGYRWVVEVEVLPAGVDPSTLLGAPTMPKGAPVS